MTLEEFTERLKEDIDEFVKKWEKGVEETPEKLTLDEWYTQYDEFQFTSRVFSVIMIASTKEGMQNENSLY